MQFIISPAAGKRLIAKGLSQNQTIQKALTQSIIVIIAGTTNAYVAEELLKMTNQGSEFKKEHFFRGLVLPPSAKITEQGRLPDESSFPGDVILEKGKWLKGKTIFDVADKLKEGDIILKGANCLDLETGRAGILIGHPEGGTIGRALQLVLGRRVKLFIAAGLEKRIYGSIDKLAEIVNASGNKGPRLWPVPGEIYTELEAIANLTGAEARLIAAGGVSGAEGSIRIFLSGKDSALKKAASLLYEIIREPLYGKEN